MYVPKNPCQDSQSCLHPLFMAAPLPAATGGSSPNATDGGGIAAVVQPHRGIAFSLEEGHLPFVAPGCPLGMWCPGREPGTAGRRPCDSSPEEPPAAGKTAAKTPGGGQGRGRGGGSGCSVGREFQKHEVNKLFTVLCKRLTSQNRSSSQLRRVRKAWGQSQICS